MEKEEKEEGKKRKEGRKEKRDRRINSFMEEEILKILKSAWSLDCIKKRLLP
jgi:hypothetical protein